MLDELPDQLAFKPFVTRFAPAALPRSRGEWEEALRSGLAGAVRRQLMSDVPLGSLLSGGVDSTVITQMMREALDSDWGRLFRNWEHLAPDANGFPTVGSEGVELTRVGIAAITQSLGILGTCVKEAPVVSNRRRKVLTE